MRKIIVTEFVTLDGVVEAPGGNETPHPHGGWQATFRHPEGGKYKLDEVSSVGALLLGKTTYENFAAFWPGQAGNMFGDRMNQLPKYVVSRSLQKADWNNSHILLRGGQGRCRAASIPMVAISCCLWQRHHRQGPASPRPHRRIAAAIVSRLDRRRTEAFRRQPGNEEIRAKKLARA